MIVLGIDPGLGNTGYGVLSSINNEFKLLDYGVIKTNSKDNLATKIDWKVIQSEMKNKFGLEIYESWLRKIDFVDEFTNYILLKVSTRFIRDWITSRYIDQILQIVKSHKKEIARIEFIIEERKQDNNSYYILQKKLSTLHPCKTTLNNRN